MARTVLSRSFCRTAFGSDKPVARQPWDRTSIHLAIARIILLPILYLAPWVLVGVVGGALGAARVTTPVALVGLGVAVFIMPMAYIGVASDRFTQGFRYDVVLVAVARNIGSYLLLLVVQFVVMLPVAGLVFVIWLATSAILRALVLGMGANLLKLILGIVVGIIGQGLLIALGYVPARVLGLYARYRRHRLPFRFGG